MSNHAELKKKVAERHAREICAKLGSVTTKYRMSANLKDELMQIASSIMLLKGKINNI